MSHGSSSLLPWEELCQLVSRHGWRSLPPAVTEHQNCAIQFLKTPKNWSWSYYCPGIVGVVRKFPGLVLQAEPMGCSPRPARVEQAGCISSCTEQASCRAGHCCTGQIGCAQKGVLLMGWRSWHCPERWGEGRPAAT